MPSSPNSLLYISTEYDVAIGARTGNEVSLVVFAVTHADRLDPRCLDEDYLAAGGKDIGILDPGKCLGSDTGTVKNNLRRRAQVGGANTGQLSSDKSHAVVVSELLIQKLAVPRRIDCHSDECYAESDPWRELIQREDAELLVDTQLVDADGSEPLSERDTDVI